MSEQPIGGLPSVSSSDTSSSLITRLNQLQSRFTWDLNVRDLDLENLSTRVQMYIEQPLGQQGAVAHAYSRLAYIRFLQQKQDEALSLLHQSEERTRECYGEESERWLIVTYGDLAWLQHHMGDDIKAQEYCQKVQDIMLKHPSTGLHPEVLGEKAWTFMTFSWSYYTKAYKCFEEVLKLQPDDSEWNIGAAIVLYRMETRAPRTSNNIEESPAVKQLRRALEVDPENGLLLSMLALKLQDKNLQEAEELVERALQTSPEHPHVIRYVGKYLRIQGENMRSIGLLQRGLQKNPRSAFIHHQLALCYKKQMSEMKSEHRVQEVQMLKSQCVKHLEEAVKIKPSFVLAQIELAHMNIKDADRCLQIFQQASQSLSQTDEFGLQLFHLRLADFYVHYNEKVEAVAHYTAGLSVSAETSEGKRCAQKLRQIAEHRRSENQRDGEALGILALVAKAVGDKRGAAELYEDALDRDADNDHFLSALCQLRMELL